MAPKICRILLYLFQLLYLEPFDFANLFLIEMAFMYTSAMLFEQ